MVSFIWSIGSVLVILLIMSLLPLGFTFRGKLSIALASLGLSLAGLAAIAVLSFWQIAIVLILLSFLTAYMMERRIGNIIHVGNEQFEDVLEEMDEETSIEESKLEIVKEENFLEITKIESIDNFESHNEIDSLNPEPILSAPEPELVAVNEMLDVDESFLLDREMEHDVLSEDMTELEEDYLSDIESLLVDDFEVKHEEIKEFDSLEDASLELLFSSDEEAGLDETEESAKKLVLQK